MEAVEPRLDPALDPSRERKEAGTAAPLAVESRRDAARDPARDPSLEMNEAGTPPPELLLDPPRSRYSPGPWNDTASQMPRRGE